jgi:hypothetical protein
VARTYGSGGVHVVKAPDGENLGAPYPHERRDEADAYGDHGVSHASAENCRYDESEDQERESL